MAMTAVASVEAAKRILAAVAMTVEARADELSALDAALGDGDHGVSLNIGWRAVIAELDGYDAPDVGALLHNVGLTIVNSVGAAMGPLYGTAFVRAGKAVAGKHEFDGTAVAVMLEAARDGIADRGKASAGDKTMLDALTPAAEAARGAATAGADALTALRAASDAAATGAIATRDMLARKGRASRLGERALGHQDAGATSVALMLKAALLALDPAAPSIIADVPRAVSADEPRYPHSTVAEVGIVPMDADGNRGMTGGRMRVALGSDDAGFPLKDVIRQHLQDKGVDTHDYSTPGHVPSEVDYPDVARAVAEAVASGQEERAILVCGTGIGMAITANKVPGVRAAQAHDVYSAERARKSNDAQVLAMGARVIGPELAKSIVDAWLVSDFAGGASTRKVEKMNRVDATYRAKTGS